MRRDNRILSMPFLISGLLSSMLAVTSQKVSSSKRDSLDVALYSVNRDEVQVASAYFLNSYSASLRVDITLPAYEDHPIGLLESIGSWIAHNGIGRNSVSFFCNQID